jgi:hypothetical protein
MQTSSILSRMIVVGLVTSWLPPLQDTSPIITANLLQVVGFLHGEIWPTYYKRSIFDMERFWHLVWANLTSCKFSLFLFLISFVNFSNLRCVNKVLQGCSVSCEQWRCFSKVSYYLSHILDGKCRVHTILLLRVVQGGVYSAGDQQLTRSSSRSLQNHPNWAYLFVFIYSFGGVCSMEIITSEQKDLTEVKEWHDIKLPTYVKTPSQVKRITQYKTAPTKQRSSNLCLPELLLLLASCWGLERVTHELSLDSLDKSFIARTQIHCTWVG